MLFNSAIFLVFLPAVLVAYYCLKHRSQNWMLLVASYVFYGWWDVRFLGLLFFSTVVDYFCAQGMGYLSTSERRRKILLGVSLCANLGVLGFFKYYNFFAESTRDLLHSIGFQADDLTLNLILPVGISFYTFQTLSYTIDVYRKQMKPCHNFIDVALYVSFFPQLVAGPIERASHLLPQVNKPRVYDGKKVVDGVWLILVGYLKKVVIADRASSLVNAGFTGEVLPFEGFDTWLFIYAFAFQIYGDFSGYSSIARGISQLMGFDLMKNFGAPYFVTNPSDFWRNWHISLSTWLRDYLYIPLGGSRGGIKRTYANLSMTMFLGGLWHGAGWAYVVWGIYQGAILILHRLGQGILAVLAKVFPTGKPWDWFWKTLGIIFFFHVTCVGWLIFRIGSFAGDKVQQNVSQVDYIWNSLQAMFTLRGPYDLDVLRIVAPLAILTCILQIKHAAQDRFHTWSTGQQVFGVVSALVLITTLGVFSGTEFIYFQF